MPVTFDGETLGRLLTLLGWDGSNFQNIKVNSDGQLQIDIESIPLPPGAATSSKQDTMITALQLIDNLYSALHSIGGDQLDVSVETSVLPSGAATSAKQDTIITALQLIDDLQGALNSQASDKLLVKAEDQLFSFKSVYQERNEENSTSAITHVNDLSAVPADEIWVVTGGSVRHNQGANKACYMGVYDGTDYYMVGGADSVAQNEYYPLRATLYMHEGDKFVGIFYGVGTSYKTDVTAMGYKMTLAS